MGLAGRLPAASPRLSRLRRPRRVAAGGDSGGVSPGHAGPHAGTQRPPPRSFRVSPTRVPVSSVATRKNSAVLGLALGRTRFIPRPEGVEGSHVATSLLQSRTWVKTERFRSHEDRLAFPAVALR